MTNKNVKNCLKGSILLFILILAFAITPGRISGQVAERSSQDETKISNELAAKFLNDLGYENATAIQFSTTIDLGLEKGAGAYGVKEEGKSITISVVSNLRINNGDSKSYDYSAQFSSSNGKRYSVDQSYSQVKRGNTTTTVATEKIVGSMNVYSQVNERKTFGAVVNKQTEGFLKVDNASESYYMNFTFMGIMNHEETVILNGTMILDQNKVEPTGQYIAKCSPKSSQLGYGTKADITLPNGTTIDPGLNWFASGLWNGNNALYGVYIWWELIFQGALDGILLVLDGLIMAGVITAPFEPLVFGLSIISWSSSAYCSTMESEWGPIYIMYASMVCYLGFIPYYGEIGYYTDRYWGVPLGDWYYIPLIQPSLLWHTCIWPNLPGLPDPPLTVLCYDESSSTYVSGVQLTLNGTWNQPSGSTVDVPPGVYFIQVENTGFHYFDIDGTPVYDNPATLTAVDEDLTVTVYNKTEKTKSSPLFISLIFAN
jgi:hypothetical protein